MHKRKVQNFGNSVKLKIHTNFNVKLHGDIICKMQNPLPPVRHLEPSFFNTLSIVESLANLSKSSLIGLSFCAAL